MLVMPLQIVFSVYIIYYLSLLQVLLQSTQLIPIKMVLITLQVSTETLIKSLFILIFTSKTYILLFFLLLVFLSLFSLLLIFQITLIIILKLTLLLLLLILFLSDILHLFMLSYVLSLIKLVVLQLWVLLYLFHFPFLLLTLRKLEVHASALFIKNFFDFS